MIRFLKRFSWVVLALFASIVWIATMVYQEGNLTPEEQLTLGIQAAQDAQPKKARRYLVGATLSDNIDTAAAAYFALGEMYRTQESDPSQAAFFYEKAAERDLAQAQYYLALMYDVGDKVPENREKAIYWMNRAAYHGLTDAEYALAVWIERGYFGQTATESSKSIVLYEQAANKGHMNAVKSLIAIYTGGFGTIPADPQKAAHWTQRLQELQK